MSTRTPAATSSNTPSTPSPSTQRRLHSTAQDGTENAPTRKEFWQWCLRADAVAKCYIRDVMALRQSEKDARRDQDIFWWLGTVPCRSVQFIGILVGARAYERRTVYTVDDGTGAIQCVHPHAGRDQRKSTKQSDATHKFVSPADIPKPCYDVGDIVRVTGRVEKWHDSFQVFATNIELCTPNDEPDHWIATAKLHETYYSQPFTIPPLPPPPPPMTPAKPASRASIHDTPGTVTTVATPSTTASTPGASALPDGPVRLRHPSRLHSKELISSTFKIYLKNYMDILSDPSRTMPSSSSQCDDYRSPSSAMESPTKRLKGLHETEEAVTPKPKAGCSRSWQGGEDTPRPSRRREGKENVTQPARPLRPKGFTLSYLRRVPELADMAFRVVHAETKRRERETRRKQKEAAHAGKSQNSLDTRQTQAEPASRKAKRLYVWAIRELYREGSIILHDDDAPVWEVSAATPDACGLWKSRETVDRSTSVDDTASSVFSNLTGGTLETEDRGELSEPPPREESYILLTPSLLAEPVMDTVRSMMFRKPRSRQGDARQTGTYRVSDKKVVGPTAEELREHMGKLDQRWENVSEYAVTDALHLLKAQDRVYKIGNGRWEISL